jgi:hypothetical protein
MSLFVPLLEFNRLRNKPVLGVVKEVGLVIEPPELQRPKAMAFNLGLDGHRDSL